MKIFLSTFGTESSTFATYPGGMNDFREGLWSEGDIASAPPSPLAGPARLWLAQTRALGWTVFESLHTYAQPAGPLTRPVYEQLRDRILSDLRECGPVDAVLLFLHGAMIADGYDDCEGDLVTRVREIVGKDTRIGIELDLHAHIDEILLRASDIIVIYKTYPHIDFDDRAQDLFDLMVRTLAGDIRPEMSLFDCKTMGLFPTTPDGPMKTFVADMLQAEGKDGILSLSLNHGFPWADVPMAGAKMLAVSDGNPTLARDIAEKFGTKFYNIRKSANLSFMSMDEAMEIAKNRSRHGGDKPVLFADVSDQTGGGAPGDTCHMVRAFLDAGIRNAAFGPIWDPMAIEICTRLGVGAKSRLRIGGKLEPQSGPPLDIDVEVLFLKQQCWQKSQGMDDIFMGDVAVIKSQEIEIVLTSIRTNVYSPDLFVSLGITLEDKQVIGVKNLFRHTDNFAPHVHEQYYVATPGMCQPDFSKLDYKRIPRPIWPLDADPLSLDQFQI
jgi:microcystin degradation protein MlrC